MISCFIIIPVLIATGTILLKNKILEELIYFDEWFQSNPVLGFFGFISMYFIDMIFAANGDSIDSISFCDGLPINSKIL